MNFSIELLPQKCDVLVIGAGPSGSACALTLAQAGLDVVLIDQHAFPRDKICGDALIPDAHKALARLGVLDAVMQHAQASRFVSCISPRGGRIDVPGTLAVLARKQLDEIVCKAAVAAGARMFAPLRFTAPIEENGKVVGARLTQSGTTCELRATWVVLATGAVPQALMAAGMAERHTPSAIAMRCYIQNDAMASKIDTLEVIWHKALAPGYGWIFPCGNGVFNIGVGIAMPDKPGTPAGKRRTPSAKATPANLHKMFDALGTISESARELIAGGTRLSPLKGAPLRCSLQGARLSRPGLLVTGEAAGSTYSFSGEGIGKALETGMLVAKAILQGANEAQVCALYQSQIDALRPRFALYERANLINQYSWLADLLIWRAHKSERLQQRLSGVLNETSNPGRMFTVKGFIRLFTE